MIFRKQNLFLFYEKETELYDIQIQLINSYMNRFVIEEEAEFEVIGIYVGSDRDTRLRQANHGWPTLNGKTEQQIYFDHRSVSLVLTLYLSYREIALVRPSRLEHTCGKSGEGQTISK